MIGQIRADDSSGIKPCLPPSKPLQDCHYSLIEEQKKKGWGRAIILIVMLSLQFFLCLGGCLAEESDQILSPECVVETLQQYVLEHSVWQPEQVEIFLRSFSPPSLPKGTVGLAVLKPTRGVTPGPRHFLISAQVDGREEARFWVDSEIQVFEDVVVTSQPLAHYETISREKVRLERRNLADIPTQPLTSFDALEGRQAARPVEINRVLTTSMVERPRVIRRGGIVTLVYESVGLHVETVGKALEAGRVGDRIRIENSSSGKVVEGEILDDRRVRVN